MFRRRRPRVAVDDGTEAVGTAFSVFAESEMAGDVFGGELTTPRTAFEVALLADAGSVG